MQRFASQSPGQFVEMLPSARQVRGQNGAIGLQLRLLKECLSHACGKADDPVDKAVQSLDPLVSLLESPEDQVPSPVKEEVRELGLLLGRPCVDAHGGNLEELVATRIVHGAGDTERS